jgi:hypothetical protein
MVSKSRKQKGGQNRLALTPAEYKGVGTLAVAGDANYVKQVAGYSSNQVGGKRKRSGKKQRGGMSYGFTNTADVPVVAGSYFPVTPMCAGKLDGSRGGNNFIGGGQRGGLLIPGGGQRGGLLMPGGGQRGGIILGGRKSKRKSRKSKKNKTQKWWQVGCKKMMGGFFQL